MMIQTVTIRQQILQALQRVYDSMGLDDLLSADRIEKELLAEFSPIAFALTPADGFDEIARANGYIKLEPGQVVVDGREHDLALHMAAKWAEYVSQRDHEARDE